MGSWRQDTRDDFFTVWDTLATELPEKLAKIREEKGLSQRKLADKIGVSRSTISLVEKGKTKLTAEVLVGYAYFCEKSLDEILGNRITIDQSFEEQINHYFSPELQKVVADMLAAYRRGENRQQ